MNTWNCGCFCSSELDHVRKELNHVGEALANTIDPDKKRVLEYSGNLLIVRRNQLLESGE